MRKISSWLSAALLSVCSSAAKANYYDSRRELTVGTADAIVWGINAGIGCAFGGIPSLVRKKSAAHTQESCLQGIAAGSIIYAGEKAASHSSTPGAGWTGHLLVGTGTSMRENLAVGNALFHHLTYHVGPVRIGVGPQNTMRWHLLPLSVAGLAVNLAYGNEWNENATAYSGTLVFDSYRQSDFLGYELFLGVAIGNVITMNHVLAAKDGQWYTVLPDDPVFSRSYEHEQVHAVQYREAGSMELVLRLSQTYESVSDSSHIAVGADVAIAALLAVPSGVSIAEFTPRMLVKRE